MDRQPSHLNDATAPLYAWPTYEDPDSDVIVGEHLDRIPGRVDLEGGWFDAAEGLTGNRRFERFAQSQLDWALGANAWGVSLMVAVGTTFPHCMQHVVANLSGSVDGTSPLVRGAVVNGPNDQSLFDDGLGEFFDEGVTCPANGKDAFARFTGHGSRFVDDVRSWQTVEPALDFTAAAMLAFSLSR